MKTRTISIPRKDILFDVDAVTHIFSSAAETKDPARADALGSDTGITFDEKVVSRFADHRAAELRDKLAHFLSPAVNNSVTVTISSAPNYEFSLFVETAFRDELLPSLADEMESYIATGAVSDWLTATGSLQQGAVYAQALPPKLTRIISYIVKRKIPERTS